MAASGPSAESSRQKYEACCSSAVQQMSEALRASGQILDKARSRLVPAAASEGPVSFSLFPPPSAAAAARPSVRGRRFSGGFESSAFQQLEPTSPAAAGGGLSDRTAHPSRLYPYQQQQQQQVDVSRESDERDVKARLWQGASHSPSVSTQRDRQLECVAVAATVQRAAAAAAAEGLELPEYLTKPIPVQLGLHSDTSPVEEKRLQRLLQRLQHSISSDTQTAAVERRQARAAAAGLSNEAAVAAAAQARRKQAAHAVLSSFGSRDPGGGVISQPECLEGWAPPAAAAAAAVSPLQREPHGLTARTPHNVAASWLRMKPAKLEESVPEASPPDASQHPSQGLNPSLLQVLCSMSLQPMNVPVSSPRRTAGAPDGEPKARGGGGRRMRISSAIPALHETQEGQEKVRVFREGQRTALVSELDFGGSPPKQIPRRKAKPTKDAAMQTEPSQAAQPVAATAITKTADTKPSSSSCSSKGGGGGVWLSPPSSPPSTDSETSTETEASEGARGDSNSRSSSTSSTSSTSSSVEADPEEKALQCWQQALDAYTQQIYSPLGDLLQQLPQRFLPPLNPAAAGAAGSAAAVGAVDPLAASGLGQGAAAYRQEQLLSNPYLFLLQGGPSATGLEGGPSMSKEGAPVPVLSSLKAGGQVAGESEASAAAVELDKTMKELFGEDYKRYVGAFGEAFPVLDVGEDDPRVAADRACHELMLQQFQQHMAWAYAHMHHQQQQQQQAGPTQVEETHATSSEGSSCSSSSSSDSDSSSSSSSRDSRRWRRQQQQLLPVLQTVGKRQHLPLARGGWRSRGRWRGPPRATAIEQEDFGSLSDSSEEGGPRGARGSSASFRHGRLPPPSGIAFLRSPPRRSLRDRRTAATRGGHAAAEAGRLSPLAISRRLGLRPPKASKPQTETHAQHDACESDSENTEEAAAEAAAAERRRQHGVDRQLKTLLQCAERELQQQRQEEPQQQHQEEPQQQQQQRLMVVKADIGEFLARRKANLQALNLKKRLAAAETLVGVQRTAGLLAAVQQPPLPDQVLGALQQQHQAEAQEVSFFHGGHSRGRASKSTDRNAAKRRAASPTFGVPSSSSSSSESEAEACARPRSAAAANSSSSSSEQNAAAAAAAAAAPRAGALLPDLNRLSRQLRLGRPVGGGVDAAVPAAAADAAELLQQLKLPAAQPPHASFSWEEEPIPTLRPRRRIEELKKEQHQQQQQQQQQQPSPVAASQGYSWEEEPIPTLRSRRSNAEQPPVQQEAAAPPQMKRGPAAATTRKHTFLRRRSGAGGGRYLKAS